MAAPGCDWDERKMTIEMMAKAHPGVLPRTPPGSPPPLVKQEENEEEWTVPPKIVRMPCVMNEPKAFVDLTSDEPPPMQPPPTPSCCVMPPAPSFFAPIEPLEPPMRELPSRADTLFTLGLFGLGLLSGVSIAYAFSSKAVVV